MTKKNDPLVTQNILEDTLTKRLTSLKDELLEAFRDYRDQILERMDKDAAEQEAIREEQSFIKYDIKNLDIRVTKLESSSKTS